MHCSDTMTRRERDFNVECK